MTRFQQATEAIDAGDVDTLRSLLARYPELNPAQRDPDIALTHENDLLLFVTSWPGGRPRGAETAELLLASGANPDTRFQRSGETVLHWAASSASDAGIIEALLDHVLVSSDERGCAVLKIDWAFGVFSTDQARHVEEARFGLHRS